MNSKVVYYLNIWFGCIFIFLMLNFSKHYDMLLSGLPLRDLILNFFALMPLAWLISLVLAAVSLWAERLGFIRIVHFTMFFFFLTVNIWSVKYEAELFLLDLPTKTLALIGFACLALALAISIPAAWFRKKRMALLDTYRMSILKGLAALSALGAAGFVMPGSGQPAYPPSEAPSLIIVSFDALSARHLSCYGYERETTPNIDSVASESWVFDNFHSNYNYTPASLTSLQGNLADLKNPKMWSKNPGLFEVLRKNGYPHRAFFSFYSPYTLFHQDLPGNAVTRSGKDRLIYRLWRHLFSDQQLIWFSQLLSDEFVEWVPYFATFNDEVFWTRNQRPGQQSLDNALQFLSEHPTGAVVWVHLWEPHHPYWPAKEFQGRFGPSQSAAPRFINRLYRRDQQPQVDGLRNRYDELVLTADSLFGDFLSALKERGLYDTSYLIVTADHGESFDGGFIGHSGPSVMESITHIPLIIHAPGNREQRRISTLASGLDLSPTILNLLGIPKLDTMPGESLVPYIEDPTKMSDRVRFAVSYSAVYGRPGEVAIYWKNYKAVYSNLERRKVRLYDLSSDPDTKIDIATKNPQMVEKLMKDGGVW